jgi:hypothetical protein
MNQRIKRESSAQLFKLLHADSKDLIPANRHSSLKRLNKQNPNRTPYNNANKTAKNIKRTNENNFNDLPTEVKHSRVNERSKTDVSDEEDRELNQEAQVSKSSLDRLESVPI